jgi:hypothetical protein
MRTAMNTLLPTLLGAIVLIAGLGSQAQAQSVYAGLLGGYAASADKENDVEPYGVGVGASAGVTLPVFPMFLGARVLYFFGDDASFGAGSGRVTLDSHYLMYGLDLGYDATLGPVTLRPGLGIGRATVGRARDGPVSVRRRRGTLQLPHGRRTPEQHLAARELRLHALVDAQEAQTRVGR